MPKNTSKEAMTTKTKSTAKTNSRSEISQPLVEFKLQHARWSAQTCNLHLTKAYVKYNKCVVYSETKFSHT